MSQLKERIAGMSLDRRALLEQRLLGLHGLRSRPQTIPRREQADPAWLSFGEQQMWFLDQLTPGTSTYNIPDAVQVGGPLDIEALEKGLQEIVRRHEVLRTHFASVDGNPVPVIDEQWKLKVAVFDLQSLPGEKREAEAKRILVQEARKPFDIAKDVTLRGVVVRLEKDEHWVLLVTHHIAWDVSSKAVLYRELASLYGGYVTRDPVTLADLPVRYSDFAAWQRDRLQGEILEQQVTYWREQLGNAARVLDLPTDRPRPPVQSFHGAKHFFTLTKSLTDAAKALSREQNVTVFMTLLAAFAAFLHGLTGQSDISIGSPMAGRNYPELENLIGFFINTTVLRFNLSADTSFRELIEQARKVTLGAHAHQDMPFEKLVELLRPPRDLSRMALIQVNFRVQSDAPPKLELPGLMVTTLVEFIDTATSKFDLALELAPEREGASFFEYNTDLFEPNTVTRMASEFEQVLGSLLAQPDLALNTFAILKQLRRSPRTMEKLKVEKPAMKSLKNFRRKTVDLTQGNMVHTNPLLADR